MASTTLDEAIDAAMRLDPDTRRQLVDILRNRQIDAERQAIADDAAASIAAFRGGTLKPQSATEVIEALRRAVDDVE